MFGNFVSFANFLKLQYHLSVRRSTRSQMPAQDDLEFGFWFSFGIRSEFRRFQALCGALDDRKAARLPNTMACAAIGLLRKTPK